MNKSNSIAPHEEVKDEENVLNRTFDRVTSCGLTAGAAAGTLNKLFSALQGIEAITRLLIADGVAVDCDEPALVPSTSGALLVAANALSQYATNDIERLADWAERRVDQIGVCDE
ncbi:hypothetical protein [Paraburkholderia xenovorans]|uniref:hypothetical protein n=1 Tax=Paraburkholderia xenovorans TaxID=36873 RepID=UPI0015C57AEE|nr:hypothetical protein [Paraburkholderia xenovorans]NPT36228.1 hypothetical protein [Paraburkholderia xenovorans]